MGLFGEELREERVRRGVSVEAICAATKLSVRNITALEAGEYGELPGGVFRRGTVRSYVAALGLDEAEWMKRFVASCPVESKDRDWVEFAENVKRGRSGLRDRTDVRWAGFGLVALFLLAIGWLVWKFLLHH